MELFVLVEEGLWDLSANRAAKKIYAILGTQGEPILSQQGSFALFSRGEIFIQLFHFASLSRAGTWNQNLFLKEIDAQTFPFVITEFPLEKPVVSDNAHERFTPEMLKKLRERYRPLEVYYPYHLYIPRPP